MHKNSGGFLKIRRIYKNLGAFQKNRQISKIQADLHNLAENQAALLFRLGGISSC
jgi:hypothetical protein